MQTVIDQLVALFPALAFLLAGVPLAVLLERVGFFRAAADILLHRNPSTCKLWVLAAATTAVLNLDTTIVLLTPLYAHIARRSKIALLPIIAIPLLLACFASSILPVSNLTNLIAAATHDLTVIDFLTHLALPSVVAIVAGWFLYRHHFPNKLSVIPLDKTPDYRALKIGGSVVLFLLLGFTLGPQIGLEAWAVALIADVALVGLTGFVPWRSIPLKTAVQVAIVAGIAAFAVRGLSLGGLLGEHASVASMAGATGLATVGANTINNLPATLVGVHLSPGASWGLWAWLIGVNFGAVLLPLGALANILWKNIAKEQGVQLTLKQYMSVSLPIGLPVLGLAFLTLIIERVLWG